jgi:glycosyltransferase involved in cell wall biosynthesis
MNISICITTLNEERTIGVLLDSLLRQSKKPTKIIIVDGGSGDKTVEIIRHYQQKDGRIKLLVEPCSRARGRNLAVEIAKEDIIAMTDAGCIADKNWLKNLTAPFVTGRVDVSAGFYKMVGESSFQKAESVFLGVRPANFNYSFLPSTRSIAFTKKIWEEVGGFPENLEGAAEDTVFNYKLIKAKAKFSRVKDAIVEWGMPASIFNFQFKIFHYAKGDVKSKIWIFPGKNLMSHNIKSLFILFRYLIGITLLVFSLKYHALLPVLIILFLIYLIWAFRKIFLAFGDYRVAFWGPTLQITSDFGVMRGFLAGFK